MAQLQMIIALRVICRLYYRKPLPLPQFYRDRWLKITQESHVSFLSAKMSRHRRLRKKLPWDRPKGNSSVRQEELAL